MLEGTTVKVERTKKKTLKGQEKMQDPLSQQNSVYSMMLLRSVHHFVCVHFIREGKQKCTWKEKAQMGSFSSKEQ